MGGAELTCRDLLSQVPDDIEVLPVTPDMAHVPAADVYVLQNIVSYSYEQILQIMGRPAIKQIHDMWPDGDDRVRTTILQSGKFDLLFSSHLHVEKFRWQIKPQTVYISPPGIDLSSFKPSDTRSDRTLWVGRMFHGKGVAAAARWAHNRGFRIDFYGFGPNVEDVPKDWYMGQLDPEEVPAVMAKYKRYIFVPTEVEPFGRTTVEAWKSGCTLIVNKNIGAMEWVSPTRRVALPKSIEAFWLVVQSAAARRKAER
jgi:glycosyltransferase involved in cell wall biosynthesis